MKGQDGILIGKLARRVGLDSRTIRFYEQAGLLPAPRRRLSDGGHGPGYRIYGAADVERLLFVKMARHLDLPLRDIKRLLGAVEKGCCGMAGSQLLTFLTSKIKEVETRMRDLRTLHGRLRALRNGLEGPRGRAGRARACPSSRDPAECAMGPSVKRRLTLKQRR